MRDMNVWHLLAVHVPNLLPTTVFGFHLPWLRKAARLIYAVSPMFCGPWWPHAG